MKIDAVNTACMWFETDERHVVPWDPEHDDQPPVETHPYACSRFPLSIRTEVYRRRNDGHYGGDDRIATMNSSASEALVTAMVSRRTLWGVLTGRPKPMPLRRAIIIASEACERCMNVLAYNYGLRWGYPELGADWRKCGTSCEMCEDMGYSGTDRERSSAGVSSLVAAVDPHASSTGTPSTRDKESI